MKQGEIVKVQMPDGGWVDGEFCGLVAGDISEDFERLTIETNEPKYGHRKWWDCHPDCVRTK